MPRHDSTTGQPQPRCPQCGKGRCLVLDTRRPSNKRAKEWAVRRRRECDKCGHRFTTIEAVQAGRFAGSKVARSEVDAAIDVLKRIARVID